MLQVMSMMKTLEEHDKSVTEHMPNYEHLYAYIQNLLSPLPSTNMPKLSLAGEYDIPSLQGSEMKYGLYKVAGLLKHRSFQLWQQEISPSRANGACVLLIFRRRPVSVVNIFFKRLRVLDFQ